VREGDTHFDGNTLFSESFANATPDQIQSYVPPAGVQLARHLDLGFSGPGSYYTDSAYNFGADPRFSNFAHTGSTATIEFFIFGVGNQSLDDESWAMDNLSVSVTTREVSNVPEPTSLALFGLGLAGLGFSCRNSRLPRVPEIFLGLASSSPHVKIAGLLARLGGPSGS